MGAPVLPESFGGKARHVGNLPILSLVAKRLHCVRISSLQPIASDDRNAECIMGVGQLYANYHWQNGYAYCCKCAVMYIAEASGWQQGLSRPAPATQRSVPLEQLGSSRNR